MSSLTRKGEQYGLEDQNFMEGRGLMVHTVFLLVTECTFSLLGEVGISGHPMLDESNGCLLCGGIYHCYKPPVTHDLKKYLHNKHGQHCNCTLDNAFSNFKTDQSVESYLKYILKTNVFTLLASVSKVIPCHYLLVLNQLTLFLVALLILLLFISF